MKFKIFKKYNQFGDVFLLFIIITLFFFKFSLKSYNEMDVVPYAKAIYNNNWLPKDWYLNLVIPYRFFFSYVIGFFANTFGIIKTIVFGRLISYLCIAWSLNALLKSLNFKKDKFFYFFALIAFFAAFPKGIGVREWVVGGLETKVFAYAFCILSIAFFLRKSLVKGVFFAGLSLSFHLLIGIYNIFCLIPILVFFQRKDNNYYVQLLKISPIFFISGAIGIYGVLNYFFFGSKSISSLGWDIYVGIRVPHHTLPSAFIPEFWIKLLVCFIINLLFLKSKKDEVRLLSWYAIMSVFISVIGLLIYAVLPLHYMKYYFFRISGILLPMITFLNSMYFLVERNKKKPLLQRIKLSHVLIVVAIFMFIFKLKYFVNNFTTDIKKNVVDDIEMADWITNNTDKNKVFITSPTDKYFYIKYNRAAFVTWKHSPQASEDIEEWYNRLVLLNSGNDFEKLEELKKGYLSLTKKGILNICSTYKNIGYILMPIENKLDLPILLKTDKNILYKI